MRQWVPSQVIDGTSILAQMVWGMLPTGAWTEERGQNLLDGAAPFYDVYACADERYVAAGAIEPNFYSALLRGLGLDAAELPPQHDRSLWPELKARFTAVFGTRTRDEWAAVFAETDACVTPVPAFSEATDKEHVVARGTLVKHNGLVQAAPAPRFSRTMPVVRDIDARAVAAADILADWGAV